MMIEEAKNLFSLRSLIVLMVLVLALGELIILPARQTNACSYTADEVITAYEAGNFRTIHTNATKFSSVITSPDGMYAFVSGDGRYRLTDGVFLGQFNIYHLNPFSSDGQFLIGTGSNRGIYRLSDFQQVLSVRSEGIIIGDGEDIISTAEISFSPNGDYVAISGAGYYREFAESSSREDYGIFRLSDGQQVVKSDSFGITFSFDSAYASMQEGIFRLNDGEKLFDIVPSAVINPIIHPDGYVYFGYQAVFRLRDRQPLFDGDFSPDNSHLVLMDTHGGHVYRLSDNQFLYNIEHPLAYGQGSRFSYSGQYIAIPSDYNTFVYRVADGALVFEIDHFEYAFSSTVDLIAIKGDGVYHLSDQEQLFAIPYFGEFSPDGVYFVAEHDGVYHLESARKAFDIEQTSIHFPFGTRIVFSPDDVYVAVGNDGLYNLYTGQKLFDIEGSPTGFTPDSAYITFFYREQAIYRVKDGQYFENLEFLNISCGILQTENTILIVNG